MASPLHADGTPFADADAVPRTALRRAVRTKHTTYLELVHNSMLEFLVAGIETGGRLIVDAIGLLDAAAHAKARAELRGKPPIQK